MEPKQLIHRTLSLDPSLTATGWSVLDTNGKVIDCGCIQTKANTKIKLKSEQDTARIHELLFSLLDIEKKHGPFEVYSESPAGSKSSTAIKALSLVKGTLLGWCFAKLYHITWVSARDAKIKATGILNAEKDQVYDAMTIRFPEIVSMLDKKNKTIKYAVTDSLSVYCAAKDRKTSK